MIIHYFPLPDFIINILHVHVLQYIYKQYLSMQVMAVRLTIDDIFFKKKHSEKR